MLPEKRWIWDASKQTAGESISMMRIYDMRRNYSDKSDNDERNVEGNVKIVKELICDVE